MLFLVDKLQYKKLLAFPKESPDSFMHSRLSPSKATFALVLKPDQVLVVMEASTDNWYKSLESNICEVTLPFNSKILDLALWDTEGCDIDGFNSGDRKAIMAVIDTSLRVSIRVVERDSLSVVERDSSSGVERDLSSKKWINRVCYRVFPPCNENLGKWSDKDEIKDLRLVGLHVSLGVVMVVYLFKGNHQYLVIEQFRVGSAFNNSRMSNLTKVEDENVDGGDLTIFKTTEDIDYIEPSRRDVIKLHANFDFIDPTDASGKKCALYCSFVSLPAEVLKLFFTHCDLMITTSLAFNFDRGERLFKDPSTMVIHEPKTDHDRNAGKQLLQQYAAFVDSERNDAHLFYLQRGTTPNDSPKIAVLEHSLDFSSRPQNLQRQGEP